MLKEVIKNTQKKVEKYVKNRKSPVVAKCYFWVIEMMKPFYFTNEFLLTTGLKRKSSSKYKSIVFFSVHKSASTFIKNTIIKLLDHENLQPVDFSGYMSSEKQGRYYNDKEKMKSLLVDKGFFYGAIRSYYDFPGIERFRVILVLRDPRDVLTSHYFSTLYNHPLSRIEVYEERKKYANQTIDEFVLENAEALNEKFSNYINHLIGKENVLFLKYEDMISNFEIWLNQLSDFLKLENNNVKEEILRTTTFKVDKEDPNSFIRNIKAGDHKNKLLPATIEKLNVIFHATLTQLNYEF